MFDQLHETALRAMHENDRRSVGPNIGELLSSRADCAAPTRWQGVATLVRRTAVLARRRSPRPAPPDRRVSEASAG